MKNKLTARLVHRYLGFFLVGIMAVYALSGVVLIFRPTHVFKYEVAHVKDVSPGLEGDALAEALELRRMRDAEVVDGRVVFDGGYYDQATGHAEYSSWEYPFVLKRLLDLHLASTRDAPFVLNVIFGLALLFFSVSSFWMFRPKTKAYREGLKWIGAGTLFSLVLLIFWPA